MCELKPGQWYKHLGLKAFFYIKSVYYNYIDYIMISEAAEQKLVAVKSEMLEGCDLHKKLYEICSPDLKPSIPFTIKLLFIIKSPGKKIDYIEVETGNKIYGG